MARAGDPCPECGHYIIVLNTKPKASCKVQYLGCRRCGYRPEENKVVIPLANISSTNIVPDSTVTA